MEHRGSVLLVEDEASARQLLAELVGRIGFRVTSTGNADEALRFLYSDEMCDAVLTDVVMPGISGVELAHRTRDIRPGLPVLLVTGKPDGVNAALKEGLVALVKPISPQRLSHVLGELLELRRTDGAG